MQELPAGFDRNLTLYFMPENRIAEHVQTGEPELIQDLIPLLRRRAEGQGISGLEAGEER